MVFGRDQLTGLIGLPPVRRTVPAPAAIHWLASAMPLSELNRKLLKATVTFFSQIPGWKKGRKFRGPP
jgi:hypothetical protein